MKKFQFIFVIFFLLFTVFFINKNQVNAACSNLPGCQNCHSVRDCDQCNSKGRHCCGTVWICDDPTPTPTTAGTPTPTPTPTDAPFAIAPITPGTDDLCTSMTMSDRSLNTGDSITVTSKAKNSDIIAFGWLFLNLDNLDTQNKPKPIKFVTGTQVAGNIVYTPNAVQEKSMTIDFGDFDRRDLNWDNPIYGHPKPKRIKIEGYFKKAAATGWSKNDNKCEATFSAGTIDPTPTPNPSCVCNTSNSCADACKFDKFTQGANYGDPIKCVGYGVTYSTAPSAAQKTMWCRYYLRTKGDANGDGRVGILDYFYYLAAKHLGIVPPGINVDFNGDGSITGEDRAVIVKSIKP